MNEKDTTQENSSYNGHPKEDEQISAFYQRHNAMSVILKKTEKITTAIYMVTDSIYESEPLRKELRTLAILLLSKTRQIAAKSSEINYAILDEIKYSSDEVTSLINLSVTIGLVSQMNGNILISEIEKNVKSLTDIFGERKVSVVVHPGYSNVVLTSKMFEVEMPETPALKEVDNGQNNKGQEIKNEINVGIKTIGQIKKDSPSKTNTLGIKIARRTDVLNIIKLKGQVSVKDIVSMLKDTSEKTIQRELIALVKEGVLKREGEKRWSVYKFI